MAFKVQARTLLHLGAELISSDAVALFELIKNAFDAGSPDVTVEVVVRLPDWPGDFPNLIDAVRKKTEGATERLRTHLLQHFDEAAPGAAEWVSSVRSARKAIDLCGLAEEANFILISDTGHGMSRADLDEIYLTIGTRNRLEERNARRLKAHDEKKRPILGEKGLGRLSVMRLGDAVQVKTTKRGEARWNLLEIDWTAFAHDIDQSIDDVKVAPQFGETKSDPEVCGTGILITNLKARWDELRLKKYADESVSKLSDPFAPKSRYKVHLRFNGTGVKIRLLETDLLKIASASVDAKFDVEGSQNAPRLKLVGTVTYMGGERVRHFAIDDLTHLKATLGVGVSMTAAWRLGPFATRVYWFNRQALRERKPDGPELVKWVNSWSGGLMLFRDGFRVHPYGEPDDDWLDLDRKALASGGYKVNRKQLIGKVEITSDANPTLTDQTNRQGLRDCPEKEALIALLKHILERELRGFLNEIADEKRAAIDLNLDELTQRAAEERERLYNNFKLLKAKHPKIREEKKIIAAMDSAIDELEQIMSAAQEKAEEMHEGRGQLVHLAGLGLLVEMIAHELNRSTRYALAALESTKDRGGKTPLPASLSNLELQLKTLEKRLKTLDPATTSGRQRKESFDVVQLTREIVEGHSAELQRHQIVCDVKTRPAHARLTVKMVKGMIVQVLENLLDNSLYWLKQRKLVEADFEPAIVVEVDAVARELRVTDNGPGVLESFKDRIFQPFFTTKPPGLGKGLGLFIARDVARYHDATLTLSDEQRTQKGRYNTFVLSFPEVPSA